MKLFLPLFFLVLAAPCPPAKGAEPAVKPAPAAKHPNVEVRIIEPGDSRPAATFYLTLYRDGEMRDIDFGVFDGSSIGLGETEEEEKGVRRSYVVLALDKEAKTSAAVLAKAIKRIKGAADPKIPTVIFVVLKGVGGESKR